MTREAGIILALAQRMDAVPIAFMSRRLVEAGLPSWSWTSRRVTWHIQHPESIVLTARRGEDLAGFAIMGFGDDAAHLNLLAVEPRYRRCGIGRQLINWLEESARVAGTFAISLEVRARNAVARRFYSALGYREADLLPGYYEQLEDAVRLTRDLRVVRVDQEKVPDFFFARKISPALFCSFSLTPAAARSGRATGRLSRNSPTPRAANGRTRM